MRKLIFGCGYLGLRVARCWLGQGHRVIAVTRSAEHAGTLAADGLQTLVADVTRPVTLSALAAADTVLYAIGYDRSGGASREQVVVGGLHAVLDALPRDTQRFLYVSSTAVYGDAGGDWVDEQSPCRPRPRQRPIPPRRGRPAAVASAWLAGRGAADGGTVRPWPRAAAARPARRPAIGSRRRRSRQPDPRRRRPPRSSLPPTKTPNRRGPTRSPTVIRYCAAISTATWPDWVQAPTPVLVDVDPAPPGIVARRGPQAGPQRPNARRTPRQPRLSIVSPGPRRSNSTRTRDDFVLVILRRARKRGTIGPRDCSPSGRPLRDPDRTGTVPLELADDPRLY